MLDDGPVHHDGLGHHVGLGHPDVVVHRGLLHLGGGRGGGGDGGLSGDRCVRCPTEYHIRQG